MKKRRLFFWLLAALFLEFQMEHGRQLLNIRGAPTVQVQHLIVTTSIQNHPLVL